MESGELGFVNVLSLQGGGFGHGGHSKARQRVGARPGQFEFALVEDLLDHGDAFALHELALLVLGPVAVELVGIRRRQVLLLPGEPFDDVLLLALRQTALCPREEPVVSRHVVTFNAPFLLQNTRAQQIRFSIYNLLSMHYFTCRQVQRVATDRVVLSTRIVQLINGVQVQA